MGTTSITIAVIFSCCLFLQQCIADDNAKKTSKRNGDDNGYSALNIPIYSLAQRLRGDKAAWIKKQMADNERLFEMAGKRDYDPSMIEALRSEKRALAGSSLNIPLMALQGKLAKQLQSQKAQNDQLFKLLGKR
ncbi:uncharacterized protein LOC144445116 [Glandiceps talaboti]